MNSATRDSELILARARNAGVNAIVAGAAGGDRFASRGPFSIPLAELSAAHEGWLPGYMSRPAA